MIQFPCSACGKMFNVPDEAAGRIGKCNKCGARNKVPDNAGANLPSMPPPRTPVTKPSPPPAPPPYIPQAAPQHVVAVQVNQQSAAAHSLGIAACLLGTLAFLICWVPFLGLLGVPLSAVGLILGIVGIVLAVVRKGSGIGFPIAGICLCGLSMLIAIGMATVITQAAKGISSELNKAQPPAADDVAKASWVVAKDSPTQSETPAVEPAAPVESPAPVQPAVPTPPEKPLVAEWADAKDALEQDGVRVRVTSVKVKFPTLVRFSGESQSKEKYLVIGLKIENVGETKKIDFKGFSRAHFSSELDPQLTDNFGNTYKGSTSGISGAIKGQVNSESIYPGKSIDDIVVFEVPIEKVEYLRLELPADYFDGTGKLKFQIPREMIVW